MKASTSILVAAISLGQTVLASPQPTTTAAATTTGPAAKACSAYKTVTTHRPMICDIVCEPTRTCNKGEPTANPGPSVTVTRGCTVSVVTGGACDCATCIALPTPKPERV